MTMTANPPAVAPEVVIVGAGIAALELVLALRELAGDRLRVTLVASKPDFVLRPMLVAEMLGRRAAERHALSEIAGDLGVRLVQAAVASVDPEQRRVNLRRGDPLPYDSLVMAHGARTVPAFDGAIEIGGTVQAQEIRTCARRSAPARSAASRSSRRR